MPMLGKMRILKCLIFLITVVGVTAVDLDSDRRALLSLRSAVGGRALLWNETETTPCGWVGVTCELNRVTKLRLPGASLTGRLTEGVFSELTMLRTLSLRSNSLEGPLPSDLASCVLLRKLYLQGNSFSGEIPASLTSLTTLVRLNLANNNFDGGIPLQLNNLTRLKTLYLQDNSLTGPIPADLRLDNLEQFNVSGNSLNGSIPTRFEAFGKSAFLETNLCGALLSPCAGTNSTRSTSGIPLMVPSSQIRVRKKKRFTGAAIAGIVIGCVVGLLLLVVLLTFLLKKKVSRKSRSMDVMAFKPQDLEKHIGEVDAMGIGRPSGGNGYSAPAAAGTAPVVAAEKSSGEVAEVDGMKKLVFFGKTAKVFNLEDLLRASAEVLGKGTFGTAYKAVLEMGITVAVKRLKDVSISEKDFRGKIESVGAMDHENLVPLKAYYYGRDEKLLVLDYMPMGSLSAVLHGNKGAGRTPLSWEIRSRIAHGTARGIEYLHSQGPNVCHGNIKSSNILLTQSYDARVSDFGLVNLVGPPSSPNRVAGYRAPEVTDPRKSSQKADVYSFGVLLLELLTGKAPTHAILNEEGVDLPRWVQSVVRDEWTSEVFDMELLRYQEVEEEMVQLLQLGVDCTAQYPDSRPSMADIAAKISELRRSSQPPDLARDEGV